MTSALGRLFAWLVIAAGVVCVSGYLMSTACCFVLAGSSLLRMGSTAEAVKESRWFSMEGGAIFIGFLGLLSLVGYLYRVGEFYGSLRYLRMAVLSAFCFLLLAGAILLVSPRRGIMGMLTGTLDGSLTARRLLPFAFLLPVLLGYLRLIGFWEGYLSTELGALLLVLSIIGCFVVIVWHHALLLNKRDAQRQQALAELKAGESRWELMINSVKDYAIFLVGTDGAVLSWNEGAARIKGYRPEEIIGASIANFYTDEEIADGEPARNLETAAATGRHYSEGWRVRRNGERFWAEIVFTAIYDENHQVQAFAKITRDMTEQKLAQEKIKEVEARLREFNERLEVQVREKTAAILMSNKELRALASHLTNVREEERAAMAREVHDELGQQLTGLKMDLSLMVKKSSQESKEWLKERMECTLGLLDTTIRTVRKIASELRPSILDDLGLVAALEWQAQEFGKRMGIPTSFETNGDDFDLSAAVYIGLFRICQESLTNVARHAAAKRVWISLVGDKKQVILAIRDDGRGIDPQKLNGKEKTLGLLGMKERALMMGGVLTIDSEAGEGMTVYVKIPMEPTTKPI